MPTMANSHLTCARLARARLIAASLAVFCVAFVFCVASIETARSQSVANPSAPVPIPAPVAAKWAVAEIPDTRLWYWDTGGSGAPIVFLHPATGSALIWGYQQPVFAKAGYRVIAY